MAGGAVFERGSGLPRPWTLMVLDGGDGNGGGDGGDGDGDEATPKSSAQLSFSRNGYGQSYSGTKERRNEELEELMS